MGMGNLWVSFFSISGGVSCYLRKDMETPKVPEGFSAKSSPPRRCPSWTRSYRREKKTFWPLIGFPKDPVMRKNPRDPRALGIEKNPEYMDGMGTRSDGYPTNPITEPQMVRWLGCTYSSPKQNERFVSVPWFTILSFGELIGSLGFGFV